MTVTLDQIPAVPTDAVFRLLKVKEVAVPHPYGITPKHLEYSTGVYMNPEEAEKKGAECFVCRENIKRGSQSRVLSYDEHKSTQTLFIEVPQNKDLNAVPGLASWLYEHKEAGVWERLGIDGFAFPAK
jgi:hypothetical protein